MNQISFQAKYLQPITIQERKPKSFKYTPVEASMVKLEEKDRDAFQKIPFVWKFTMFGNLLAKKILDPDPYSRFFALTTQQDNFEKLDINKVLGLAEMFNGTNNSMHLDIIQIRGDVKHHRLLRKYKRIGTAMLDYFKANYNAIILNSRDATTKFYEINGFKHMPGKLNRYRWEKLQVSEEI